MHWELSEEQELFTTALREWLQERARSEVVRGWLDAGDPAGFEQLFVGEGWSGVGFDEDRGGIDIESARWDTVEGEIGDIPRTIQQRPGLNPHTPGCAVHQPQ